MGKKINISNLSIIFKLSVIIPIYNSESYLANCIDSVCKQANRNVEIVLINDGSTDETIKICRKYIKKFNFIKLINLKKNRGVANARNVGIRSSLGEFICFLDSDDVLLPGSIANFFNHIKIYNTYKLFVIRNFTLKKKIKNTNYDLKNLIPNERKKSILRSSFCWNFLVKKEFLISNNIFFKNLKVTEDWVFVSEILCRINKYKIIEKPFYMYRMHEPNTTGKKTGYLIAVSRLKVIIEIGKIISKEKIYLNEKKIYFIKRLLNLSVEQMYSNIILCNSYQIHNIIEYLKNNFSIIIKLSKLGFKKFNKIIKIKKNLKRQLIDYKLKSHNKIKKILKKNKNKNKNIIIFCAGGYGKTAYEILSSCGAKIDLIIDNNLMYHEKKINQTFIKSPLYLKKNINKLYDFQIFICNKKKSVFNLIKLQLKKIGFEDRNIIHFNV